MKNITRTLLGSALITAACAPQGEKTVSYVQSKPQVDGAPARVLHHPHRFRIILLSVQL